jgi:hypothetical protein
MAGRSWAGGPRRVAVPAGALAVGFASRPDSG